MAYNPWVQKTDDDLRNAAAHMSDYTAAGQDRIISEMRKRGMTHLRLCPFSRTTRRNTCGTPFPHGFSVWYSRQRRYLPFLVWSPGSC